MSSISIRRIVKKTELIQRKMTLGDIASSNLPQSEILRMEEEIYRQTKESSVSIERVLSKQNYSAADLAIRSRRAYQWLKFLSDRSNLKIHLQALNRVNQLLTSLAANCHKEPSQLNLAFYHISPLYKVKKIGKTFDVLIQECFVFAPDEVLHAILKNTLCPPQNKNNKIIHEFTSGSIYQEKREYLEYLTIPPASYSAGEFHDLRISFDRVNQQYFDGGMSLPHLVWSRRLTRRKFGHYQSDTNTISISRTLDHPSIPAYVVDYVMYHELLHKHIGTRHLNDRRYTHTPQFKRAEERFERFQDAQKYLSKLSRSSS
jgi:hypothetical protein